jgi:hypothetical protein
MVRGLRAVHVPVCVLGRREWQHKTLDWDALVTAVATGQRDEVTLAMYNFVHGLERPVVVWLVGRIEGEDDDRSDELIDATDRLFLVSRCTTQLIIVDVPK